MVSTCVGMLMFAGEIKIVKILRIDFGRMWYWHPLRLLSLKANNGGEMVNAKYTPRPSRCASKRTTIITWSLIFP